MAVCCGAASRRAKPWALNPIPSTFQFQLPGEDWHQYEPPMLAAMHRTPCLETAKVKMLLNGPESLTPDGNFILGEAPECANHFVAARFNSAGIANFGAKTGWERANYFKPAQALPAVPGLGRPGWLDGVIAEQRATREALALYDQTSFTKLLQGRAALALLQRLCANEIDVPMDKLVCTPLLNERSGFESDLTVIRLAPERFLIVTGSTQATRDMDWISRRIGPNEHAHLSDVSALYSVLSVMGPKARELLARVGSRQGADELAAESLKFLPTREIDVGFARVRAARMSRRAAPKANTAVRSTELA